MPLQKRKGVGWWVPQLRQQRPVLGRLHQAFQEMKESPSRIPLPQWTPRSSTPLAYFRSGRPGGRSSMHTRRIESRKGGNWVPLWKAYWPLEPLYGDRVRWQRPKFEYLVIPIHSYYYRSRNDYPYKQHEFNGRQARHVRAHPSNISKRSIALLGLDAAFCHRMFSLP